MGFSSQWNLGLNKQICPRASILFCTEHVSCLKTPHLILSLWPPCSFHVYLHHAALTLVSFLWRLYVNSWGWTFSAAVPVRNCLQKQCSEEWIVFLPVGHSSKCIWIHLHVTRGMGNEEHSGEFILWIFDINNVKCIVYLGEEFIGCPPPIPILPVL